MSENQIVGKVGPLFKALSLRKKILWITMIILSPILMSWLAVWGFANHSIAGLFDWSLTFRTGIVIAMVFCIGMPGFLVLDLFIAHRRAIIKRFPSRTMWIMPLIAVILPISLFSVVGLGPIIRWQDKDPELLMADGTGINGIPDMAVAFWNVTACTNTLSWGINPNNLNNTIQEKLPSQGHALMLTNLLSNTTYYYSINKGTLYNFTTAPGINDTYTFAVGSDAHVGRIASNTTATIKMLEEIADPVWGNNAFFFLGDMVEYGFYDSMWTQAINMFSPYTSHIPYRPILGNHDTLLGGLPSWEEYFYPPGMEENSSSSPDYFQIVENNIHFFCMDLEWGNDTNSPAQYAWFKSELAQVPAGSWIIVMAHAFWYSSGEYTDGAWWWDNAPMIQAFAPLFQQYGVQMVFSGHNHHLETLVDNGTHYFIDGGFGGLPDPPNDRNGTGSIWDANNVFGYNEVNINGNSANVSFVSPEGFIYSSFTVNKTNNYGI